MIDEDYEDPVVMDLGSKHLKCGFAGQIAPKSVFTTVVGTPRHSRMIVGLSRKGVYIGEEAFGRRGLHLENAIEFGTITTWDGFEKILHHAFYNELRVGPEERPLLIADKIPYSPKVNRERMTQIVFETFEVPKFYANYQSILALYAHGKTSGITVDSGYQTTYCIPIHEGVVMDKQYVISSDIGGKQVTNYLKELLSQRNIWHFDKRERSIPEEIKKKLCYSLTNRMSHEM